MTGERDNLVSLNAQIKLLVRTEQRLYRSQLQLDLQLARIQALARWSLAVRLDETPDELLVRSLSLFTDVVDCDWALALALGDGGGVEASVPAVAAPPRGDPAEAYAWLLGIEETCALPANAPLPPAVAALIAAVRRVNPAGVPLPLASDALLVLVPIRTGGVATAMVVLCTVTPRRVWAEGEASALVSFLQVAASHVENGLANARLSLHLRKKTEELEESVAKLERAQHELVHAHKMEAIGELAGGVAHEFNNLLTVIMSHALLVGESVSDESVGHDVAAIVRAGERATTITRQLLALGRRQRLAVELVDLNRVVPAVAEVLRHSIGEHIELRLNLDLSDCTVLADRSQVEQVLLNLVVNARDAMPDGGALTLTTRPATAEDCPPGEVPACAWREHVVLEVADTGHGIDPESLGRVFEPFFTTKPRGTGSGMGLAVVYGIVTQSRGTVSVSARPAGGTCFKVVLPRPGGAEKEATPQAEPRGTILVVEDEDAIRRLARRVLERAGFAVLDARDGDEAMGVWRARTTPIHLVLSDVVMPRMGGVELCSRIRAEAPDLPLILMSGYAADLVRDVEAASGARYLAKPFGPAHLLSAVEAALLGE